MVLYYFNKYFPKNFSYLVIEMFILAKLNFYVLIAKIIVFIELRVWCSILFIITYKFDMFSIFSSMKMYNVFYAKLLFKYILLYIIVALKEK